MRFTSRMYQPISAQVLAVSNSHLLEIIRDCFWNWFNDLEFKAVLNNLVWTGYLLQMVLVLKEKTMLQNCYQADHSLYNISRHCKNKFKILSYQMDKEFFLFLLKLQFPLFWCKTSIRKFSEICVSVSIKMKTVSKLLSRVSHKQIRNKNQCSKFFSWTFFLVLSQHKNFSSLLDYSDWEEVVQFRVKQTESQFSVSINNLHILNKLSLV